MKRVKKIFKILAITIATLIVVPLVLIQTPWMKGVLKNQIVKIANNEINGTLNIEKIRGNFFKNIEIVEITISDTNSDTILNIDKLGVKYSLLDLFVGRVTVNDFYLLSPQINIQQFDDNSWNFESLIISDTTKVKEEKSEPFDLKIAILIDKIRLENGEINIINSDSIIPKKIENLDINISAFYSRSKLLAKLNKFSFDALNPDFTLENLIIAVNYDFKKWQLDKFSLETALNLIEIGGDFTDFDNFSINLNWNEINVEEFKEFAPLPEIIATPNFNFAITNSDTFADISLNIESGNNLLNINGSIINIGNFIESDSTKNIEANLKLSLSNINPNSWIKMEPMGLVANGEIDVFSENILNEKKPIKLFANLDNSKYNDFVIDKSDIDISYLSDNILANLDVLSNVGQIKGNAGINTLENRRNIDANISIKEILLHSILTEQLENSVINSGIKAKGSIINDSIIDIDFLVDSRDFIVEHIHFDTLKVAGKYKNDLIQIDDLEIANNSLALNSKVSFIENNFVDAKLNLILKNIDEFSHYVNQDVEWQLLQFKASANGGLDSLAIDLLATIDEVKVDSLLSIGKTILTTKGNLINNNPFIDGDISVFKIVNDNIEIDTATINYAVADSLWNVELITSLFENMLLTKISGDLNNFEKIEIEKLEIENQNNLFQLSESAQIHFNDSLVSVSNLNIYDKINPDFSWISNVYLSKDDININTDLRRLNLKVLNDYEIIEDEIGGYFNFNFNITKQDGQIVMDGKSNIEKVTFDTFFIDDIDALFNYNDDEFNSKIALRSEKNDSLILNAHLPMSITFDDSLHVAWNNEFDINIFAKELLLNNYFENIKGFTQPEALLNMDFNIAGDINSPKFDGFMNIDKGNLPLPEFGINYKDIKLRLNAENNIINIDSLYVCQKGWLLTKGFVELDEKEFGEIKNASLSIKSNDFQLAKHKNYDALIDSDISFTHSEKESKYSGFVNVLRSSFNIDALTDFGGSQSFDTPMLIQAIEESTDTTVVEIDEVVQLKAKENDLLANLTGSLKVEIPRNCWIKSDDMQMELYGNLDVIKNSTFFELFGSLGVHRGFYTFYGKKMVINEGEFTFSGGEKFNPALNLNALYTFRTPEREKKTLSLVVGGDLEEPIITFAIGKQDIPEADAIAYLLFGQPFDQLNDGSQSGVSDAIASRLFSNMIASQLSKTLGKTLNLDLVEVDPTDNWQNTTFTVGKYLTNDLFVTYQRSFGESDDNEISRETISLEYEFTKRLSLRLLTGKAKESGVDLIIKLEK